jgi:hypothetical protein
MSLNLPTRREFLGGLLAAGSVGVLGGVASAADTRIAALVAGATRTGHDLAPPLRLASETLQRLDEVKDYSATFFKHENVRGGQVIHNMNLKVREKPFSVYLGFLKPHTGREVIYVAGQNGGNLLAHGTGIEKIAGTVSIAPNSAQALEESRYPITKIGMRNMVTAIATQWGTDLKYNDLQVKYYANAKVGNVSCRVYESTQPRPRKGVVFYRSRLYVTRETELPVRVEQFGFPSGKGVRPPMIEQYTYMDLKTNIGLRDIDFSTSNPSYDY